MMQNSTARLLLILVAFLNGRACPGEPALPLPSDNPLERIAFGSCAKSNLPQPIWNAVVAARPGVFIFAGDNIYADTRDMKVMKTKYARLAAQPGFQRLLREIPVLATWDDHDYGADDSGANYPKRAESQNVFMDFFGEPKGSQRRATPGVYDAKRLGPAGKQTQIILLDTRYFRGPLKAKPQTETKIAPSSGRGVRYAPQSDPAVTVLGGTQWDWLEKQLRQPADLRLIVSSIQVVSEDHDSENWANFPLEQAKLFRLIRDTRAEGVLFLSGDVHKGELSVRDAGVGYPLFDLTSSGLTQASSKFHFAWPNRYRISNMGWGNNFGMIVVDWDREDPEIRMQILDESGDIAIQRKIPMSLLKRGALTDAQTIRNREVEAAVSKRHQQLRAIRQAAASVENANLPDDRQRTAKHRGLYEIQLRTAEPVDDPFFGVDFRVAFIRPDGSQTVVDGFFDGDRTFRARAYCDTTGRWQWRSVSNQPELDGKQGTFQVVKSALPGKLRKHPDDPRQFAFENGQWFLHLGDTGYRYVAKDESHWREYIDQAAEMGATKIRVWFNQERHGVAALFDGNRGGFNLSFWQEMDRRIAYAYERHPDLSLQLIPFGEDTDELRRFADGDRASAMLPRYAQARFSAYPSIQWCVSNDREIVGDDKPLTGRRIRASTIDKIGRDMAKREPWKTLITNHQSRFKGFSFVDASWSDIITLEDLDQVSGQLINDYRSRGDDPIVLDEDRYETYRPPLHPRYFFRRMMWASLLSGGMATYGGLRTYEPEGYDAKNTETEEYEKVQGIHGYYDAVEQGLLLGGADCFRPIRQFFDDAELTLVGMTPDDPIAGGNGARWKCAHGDGVFVIYLANPSGTKPETDQPSTKTPSVTVQLPRRRTTTQWFQPESGRWTEPAASREGQQTFEAPGPSDWVLLLRQPN